MIDKAISEGLSPETIGEVDMCKCGCECCKVEKVKTTGLVFNPWPETQERVFYGHVFARKEDVKPGEKSLVVTNRCRIA